MTKNSSRPDLKEGHKVLLKTRLSESANYVGHLKDLTIHVKNCDRGEECIVEVTGLEDGYYVGEVEHQGGLSELNSKDVDFDVREFHKNSRWFPERVPGSSVTADGTTKNRGDDRMDNQNELIAKSHKL